MNFFLILNITVLIISQKLYLFNEEFLILICFTAFSFLIYVKLNDIINNFFFLEMKKIKNSILFSYKQISVSLNSKQKRFLKTKEIQLNFLFLKNYYKKFNLKISDKLFIIQNTKKFSNFFYKLEFIKINENQFFKLLLILLVEKINNLILNINFFKNINVFKFNVFKNIKLREYINNF